jgi:hypothetical protein
MYTVKVASLMDKYRGLYNIGHYQINHDVLTMIEGIHKEREVKQEVL